MVSLAEFRQQYPQYGDMSDDALADALHKKFYSDIPPSDFRSRLGLERKSYSASEVPGAVAENFMPSARRVKEAFVNAASNPVQTAAALAKIVTPGASQAEGGATFAESVKQDYGFNEPTWGGQYEQVKRHVAEQPLETAADVSMVASPLGGRVGSVSRGINLPYQAARVATKPLLPVRARPGYTDASTVLRGEGVSQTAGQATGSRPLKYAESELGGGNAQTLLDRQAEEFTRAASRRIGEDSPHLDTHTMNTARARIGNDFNQLGARNNIPNDPQLGTDLNAAVHTYVQSVPIPAPGVQNMANAIAARGAQGIPGQAYNAFRSRLSRLQRNTKDPQLTTAYHDMRNALDNAMERSLTAAGNQADLQAFQTARQQYRNYIVLESAMATGPMAGRGLLTPQHLESAAASGPNRTWYARGMSDFSDLGKAARAGMEPMPESGTAVRSAIRGATGLAGGMLVGGGAISPEAALGVAAGIAAPTVAGKALMSPPVQGYLRTQIPGRTAIGRAASTVTAAIPRAESLKHIENVVSAPVLEDIKSRPETRHALNEWLVARNSRNDVEGATRRLAEAIAQRLGRDDLVDRIVVELGETKGP
jgi:hypothetical protein